MKIVQCSTNSNLKYLRQAYGLSIPALADKVGLSPETLSEYEGPHFTPVNRPETHEKVCRLATFYNLFLDELVLTDIQKNPSNRANMAEEDFKTLLLSESRNLPLAKFIEIAQASGKKKMKMVSAHPDQQLLRLLHWAFAFQEHARSIQPSAN